MKKKLLTLLLLCSTSISSWAQDMTHVLVVEQKDGWSTKFSLLKKPVISVEGNEIYIHTETEEDNSGTGTTYFTCPLDIVKKYYFIEEDATAINDAKTDKQEVKVTYTNDQNVIVSGLAETDRLCLYALDGRKVTDIASEGGQANICLAELSAGVYVVNINSKQSFKIMKR